MEAEQIREFGQLQSEITERLRRHAYIDDKTAWHAFQYLVLPSFTPPIAWDVFRRPRKGHSDEYVLVRSSWRSDVDLEKLRTPTERLRHPYPLSPTIEVHQLAVASSELQRLAEELAAVEVPIGAPPAVVGLDGVVYEVAIEQPAHFFSLSPKCRLSWWCEVPARWEQLGAWAKRAMEVFENAWANRGNDDAVPLCIPAVDDAAARHEAQHLFHDGHYGRAAELLSDVAKREQLTPAETKTLGIALRRAGGKHTG